VVVAVPEGLPLAVTISLAYSTKKVPTLHYHPEPLRHLLPPASCRPSALL
jgi:hypothetical protein